MPVNQGIFRSLMTCIPIILQDPPPWEQYCYLLFLDPEEEFFLLGTFAPSSRASERPIAMACFGLVTFLPLRPLFNVPSFISSIDFLTLDCDSLEYCAIELILIKKSVRAIIVPPVWGAFPVFRSLFCQSLPLCDGLFQKTTRFTKN